MIEQLLNLVQENTQEAVVENTAVPDKHNRDVQKEISNSIQGEISSAISSGNIAGVMDLFSKGTNQQNIADNPMLGNISSNLISNLSQKFGLSKEVSEGIAKNVLPMIMKQFSKKVADPEDKSVDMNTVVKSATKGKDDAGIDFNDILSQFTQGKGGDIDFGKIAGSLISGSSGKNGKAGGGLLDMVSGFFK